MKSQLKSGVILSYINLSLSTIIPLVYTPIMLRMLGQSEYGIYSLASSTISYLSLLSFGFGATIVRYIAKYRAEGNEEEVKETYGFFILLYIILAIIVFCCGVVISLNVDNIFYKGLTNSELNKTKILLLIMSFNTALSFPLSVFSSVVVAYERYVFRKIVDMLSTIIAPLANLIVLYLGFASVGMCLTTTCIQFAMLPLNVFYCSRVLKISPRFSALKIGVIKEMLGFSFFVFLGSIADMLFWSTDKVILGMLASSAAVAVYNIGGTFNSMIMNLSTSISGVLAPRITAMVVKKNESQQLSELFIKIGRLQYLVIALVISGYTVFGRQFIYLWAGPEYNNAYYIALLTIVPLSIPLIQNTGLSVLIAQNRHQFRSIVYLVIAIINAVSTYFAVPYYGIYGAAICSCISYLIGQGYIMNIYYYKKAGINIPEFWRQIMKMSIIPFFMMSIGLLIAGNFWDMSWGELLGGIIIYTGLYFILMYKFVMNEYEINLFHNGILRICKLMKHYF